MINIKDDSGLTLVEVAVSLLLVAIIVVSLIALMAQSSVFSKRIDLLYRASYLAQRRIDIIKRFDYDQLAGTAETNVRIDLDGNIDPNGNYVRTTEVVTNYNGNEYLTKVKVSVNRVRIGVDGTVTIGVWEDPVIMETLLADLD